MASVDRAFDIESGSDGEAPEPYAPSAPFRLPDPPDSDTLAALAAEMPDLDDLDTAGPVVLARLLGVEQRPDRFQRLLRTWIAKITDAVQRGDVEDVRRWMQVVTRDLEPAEDLVPARDQAIEDLAGAALLESLVVALVERGDPKLAAEVLGDLAPGVFSQLVEWMAVDDPPVSRRHIVDLLAFAGRQDVRSLAIHLADPRWFVVRNVCIALGRTGRAQAAEPVMTALEHEDDRVRVEALRSLAALQGEQSVPILLGALRDSSRRVRHAVVSLLRASPSRLVVPGLADVVESGALDAEHAVGLVALIAERTDESVDGELERLASRRRAVGVRRAVRDAARRALAQRAS
jgi:HEAT repeat protein